MKYLNLVIDFYMQMPVINTIMIIALIAIGFFAVKYKKVKLETIVMMGKLQLQALTGQEKFEKLVNWLLNTRLNKASILSKIPESWKRKWLQKIYDKYRSIIKV